MTTISVSHLKKYFKIYKRLPGFFSALKSLYSRPYETVKAVDDISFEIDQGELIGFIGPNGAGKTTTLKCLSGLLYPSDGHVSVLGFDPFQRKSVFLRQISLVMGQKNQLWWDLPALETFRLNKEIYEITDTNFEETLSQLTKLLEVKDLLTTPVRQLSLGQRMKMELIATLIHKPRILFLDEPTIGLDVVMQKKIRDFILEYNRRFKSTILLTSHYMADVKELCKRVIIINRGKIVYDGDFDNLVSKYANFKTITMEFGDNRFDAKQLVELGKIKYINSNKIALIVPRAVTKNIASIILRKFPIEDLTIEEPEIEEIVRIVFSKKKNEKIHTGNK